MNFIFINAYDIVCLKKLKYNKIVYSKYYFIIWTPHN